MKKLTPAQKLTKIEKQTKKELSILKKLNKGWIGIMISGSYSAFWIKESDFGTTGKCENLSETFFKQIVDKGFLVKYEDENAGGFDFGKDINNKITVFKGDLSKLKEYISNNSEVSTSRTKIVKNKTTKK